MQSEPEINGEPESDEAADLGLLFRQSSPRFTSVNVDAVLRDINGGSQEVVSRAGAPSSDKQNCRSSSAALTARHQ